MSIVRYKNHAKEGNQDWVYYTGTDTLNTGYALCEVEDYGTVADADEGRLARVQKPDTNSLENFKGVVHPSCDGVEGPCQVLVVTSGAAKAYTDADLSGSWAIPMRPQNGSYAMTDASGEGDTGGGTGVKRGNASSRQKVDRSGTAGLALVEIAEHGTPFLSISDNS